MVDFPVHQSLLFFLQLIMSLQHSAGQVEKVVKSVNEFSECYSNAHSLGWNSQVMEFKPFIRSISSEQTDNFYFRLFHAHSSMKYVKEKYQKLFKQFQGLFVNVQAKLTSQKMHDCVYLIRGTENYFSLERLIQKQERKVLSISFILNLLQFFNQILMVNQKLKLKIDVSTSTILEKDGIFKLADYKLLFHPNNLRSKDQDLEQKLITQMKYVIFDILSLKNWETRQKFQENCMNLVNLLRDRRSECNDFFVKIIETFFKKGIIMTDEIVGFKNKVGVAINETAFFQSTMTSSDISIPLLQRQQTCLSEQNSSEIKPKIDRKKLWRIMFISLIVVLIGALGLTYFFLTRDIDCGNFHYKQNSQCYKCPDSCYSCLGGGQYNCTYCVTNYWLVLKQVTDKVGKCAVDCMGFKDSSTMHCLPYN